VNIALTELKFASLCIPHLGGPFIFADNLRHSLADQGIELRWVGVGTQDQRAVEDPLFSSQNAFGEVTGVNAPRIEDQAFELVRHLCERRYDGVLIHVLAGELQANIARYLPAQILRIMIVHSITRGTYRYARAVRDYVHVTIGASPRIPRDLVTKFGFPAERCLQIPHGVDIRRYCARQARRQANGRLRILSLGRIENQSKGVFRIPDILGRLKGLDLRLTVVGDGPDLEDLKNRASKLDCPVDFTGRVSNDCVPELFGQHDLFLMPSYFEGFPLTLIEAMAAGCVPVVSRIRLVTDQVVDHGVTGWLFEAENPESAAAIVRRAYSDRTALRSVSQAAQRKARESFSSVRMGESYAGLMRSLKQNRPPIPEPLSLSHWELPRGIRPGISRFLPESIKPLLRRWRERLFY